MLATTLCIACNSHTQCVNVTHRTQLIQSSQRTKSRPFCTYSVYNLYFSVRYKSSSIVICHGSFHFGLNFGCHLDDVVHNYIWYSTWKRLRTISSIHNKWLLYDLIFNYMHMSPVCIYTCTCTYIDR